jgi:hypothetical protein
MGTLLSPSQECHPFSPLPLSHDLVVSADLSITKVDVQGEKAMVVADLKTKGQVTRTTFEMIKENEKWLITAFRY